jgi:transposase
MTFVEARVIAGGAGHPRWSASWPRCAPVPAMPPATPPASRCGSWGGALSSPGGQLGRLDELIIPPVITRAPGLPALHGVGPDTAALLLIAAGGHPHRLRSEAAWAHLCAVAPIPASSGKVTRHRLNPGGTREASHALWRIVITQMSSHAPTRAHAERRSEQGLPNKEIIRCLKRYAARGVCRHLRAAGG